MYLFFVSPACGLLPGVLLDVKAGVRKTSFRGVCGEAVAGRGEKFKYRRKGKYTAIISGTSGKLRLTSQRAIR